MKGIIVDIKGTRAVVLRSNGVFDEIPNKNYVIGQKIKTTDYRQYAAAAACMLAFVSASIGGFKFYHTPFSYIYIDINPSIRLDLNYFDRVIDYAPLNSDAEGIKIKYGNVVNSIDYIIEECGELGFLNVDNNEVEINIMTAHKGLAQKVNSISELYKSSPYTVIIDKTTKDKSLMANDYEISVKQLEAIKEYSDAFGGTTEDNILKLKDTPVDKIRNEIDRKQISEADIKAGDKAPDVKNNVDTSLKSENISQNREKTVKAAKGLMNPFESSKQETTVVSAGKNTKSSGNKTNIAPTAEKAGLIVNRTPVKDPEKAYADSETNKKTEKNNQDKEIVQVDAEPTAKPAAKPDAESTAKPVAKPDAEPTEKSDSPSKVNDETGAKAEVPQKPNADTVDNSKKPERPDNSENKNDSAKNENSGGGNSQSTVKDEKDKEAKPDINSENSKAESVPDSDKTFETSDINKPNQPDKPVHSSDKEDKKTEPNNENSSKPAESSGDESGKGQDKKPVPVTKPDESSQSKPDSKNESQPNQGHKNETKTEVKADTKEEKNRKSDSRQR